MSNLFAQLWTKATLWLTSDAALLPGFPHRGEGGIVHLHGLHLATGDDPASGPGHKEDLEMGKCQKSKLQVGVVVHV